MYAVEGVPMICASLTLEEVLRLILERQEKLMLDFTKLQANDKAIADNVAALGPLILQAISLIQAGGGGAAAQATIDAEAAANAGTAGTLADLGTSLSAAIAGAPASPPPGPTPAGAARFSRG